MGCVKVAQGCETSESWLVGIIGHQASNAIKATQLKQSVADIYDREK